MKMKERSRRESARGLARAARPLDKRREERREQGETLGPGRTYCNCWRRGACKIFANSLPARKIFTDSRPITSGRPEQETAF